MSGPPFSIVPVSGFHYPYPYPVQQNPVMVMSSPPQVQFPVQIQPAQSQFPPPQVISETSPVGQTMVLIPLHFGQQPIISSQFPPNVNPDSIPTCQSSSDSTVPEFLQTCSCPTETLNQTHGGFVQNGGEYYLLEPVSAASFQTDQNPVGEIGNNHNNNSVEESSASTASSSSSNGLDMSQQQQNSFPLSSWNFPLHHQPTPVYQYVICPAPLQFPSIPVQNFDGNFEHFYKNSSFRKDAAWSKIKKNSQAATPPKPMCGFCKSNREPKEVYRGHWLRNDAGMLTCPSLRKYVCPACKATGDNAHTIKYCPESPPCSNPSESENSTKEIIKENKELEE